METVYKDQLGETHLLDIRYSDVILWRNNFRIGQPMTWLSGAIRGFTGFKYNHAGIIVSNWDKLFINEALKDGIKARPIERHLSRSNSNICVLRPKVRPDEREFAVFANSFLGVGYDLNFTVIASGWYWGRKGLAAPKNKHKVRWAGPSKSFHRKKLACAEYAALTHNLDYAFRAAPVDLFNDTYFDLVYDEVEAIREKKEALKLAK